MAKLIRAISEYGPKLELTSTVETEDVIEWVIANDRLLSRGMIQVALMQIVEAIQHFNCQGIPVKLEGLGIFTPSIDRNGTIKHGYRADVKLKQHSNTDGAYTGEIANRERIGLDNTGYKELWDSDHPDDPLEI